MNVEKLRIMMNTFALSQFSHCPLIWMFHDRSANKKINKMQERAPRKAELLKKAESVSIHQRNIKLLTTEVFKLKAISILVS